MKLVHLIPAVTLIFLMSCQNKEANTTEPQAENQEEKLEESTQDKKTAQVQDETNYLITEGQVGHIKKDEDRIFLNPGESHTSEIKTLSEEGTEYQAEFDYILNEDKDTLIMIDDYGFWIYSPDYHTEDNISTASCMSDFFGKYPDAKIEYSYVSGMFWMSNKSMDWIEFILPNDAYHGEEEWLMQSDLVEIAPQDMDETAKITKIRVF